MLLTQPEVHYNPYPFTPLNPYPSTPALNLHPYHPTLSHHSYFTIPLRTLHLYRTTLPYSSLRPYSNTLPYPNTLSQPPHSNPIRPPPHPKLSLLYIYPSHITLYTIPILSTTTRLTPHTTNHHRSTSTSAPVQQLLTPLTFSLNAIATLQV